MKSEKRAQGRLKGQTGKAKKALGQHFLVDRNVLGRIIAVNGVIVDISYPRTISPNDAALSTVPPRVTASILKDLLLAGL